MATYQEIIEERRKKQQANQRPITGFATGKRTPFAERQGLVQTIFSAPLNLGRDIFQFTSTAKALKTTELRAKSIATQIKNSDMDKRRKQELANLLDGLPTYQDVVQPRNAKQIIGDAIGTALFLAPGTFGIKGATKTATLLRGAVGGGAFGGAEALSSDATTGQFFKQMAIGSFIGAPLNLGGVMAGRFAAIAAKKGAQATSNIFTKLSKTVPGKFFTSIGRQLERDYGENGKLILNRFLAADRKFLQRAGGELDELNKAGLFDLDDLQALRLADALEGKGQITPDIHNAYKSIDRLRRTIAAEAQDMGFRVRAKSAKGPDLSDIEEALLFEAKSAGIKIKVDTPKDFPFKPRENYFPHMVPSVDKLQKGQLRMNVLKNAVRNEVFKTEDEAAKVLDSYLEFTAREGKGGKYWVNWLVESGQAKTKDEARGMALRFFRRSRIQRSGSLERIREIDYPFYDPDPRSVIPAYLIQTLKRLEEAEQFGMKFEKIDAIMGKIRTSKGADTAREVARLVNRARGIVDTSPAKDRWSYYLRAIQVPKLAFAQVANIGQNLNTLLQSDLKSFSKGVAYAFTNEGKRRALQTGATLESVLRQAHETSGVGAGMPERFLKWTGFSAIERGNRIAAANVGFEYARSTFLKLQRNTANQVFKQRLEELGIKAEQALQRGSLTEYELQRAGQVMAEITQFRGRNIDLPAFSASPEGKVFFQYKSFAYQQAKFLKDRFKKQVEVGNYKGIARDLIVLGTVFPMTGEVIADIRSLVTGSKRETDALERYFENFLAVGGFGIVSDTIVSANYGYLADNLLGPSVGTITEAAQRLVQATLGGDIRTGDIKFLLRQTGFGRTIANYVYPNNRKEQETFLKTLQEVFDEL